MEERQEPTFWAVLNPMWMIRCCPNDFRGFRDSICPGIGWLPGIVGLLGIHVACFYSFISQWWWHDYTHQLWWSLAPLGVLWTWLVVADIKFRRQGPTSQERAGFDNAVVNWFGFALTIMFYWLAVPVGIGVLLWWWLA